ncbi:MAG TPA: glycosyltransferase [Blastocatellia bacterium]|jgi:GT2 family glycosyltransferase|nr:glycosyltransferase [Blastocatellia bacterium]
MEIPQEDALDNSTAAERSMEPVEGEPDIARVKDMIERLSSQLERERESREALSALLRDEQVNLRLLITQMAEQHRLNDQQISSHQAKIASLIELLARRQGEAERPVPAGGERGATEKDLLAEIERKEGEAALLRNRVAEIERSLKAQADESRRAITARDQKLAWLSAHTAEKERAVNFLSVSLSDLHAHLNKMNNSIGWRWLNRYGRIKYRYLLPFYRMLGLMPKDSNAYDRPQTQAQPVPPGPTISELLESMQLPGPSKEVDFYGPLTLLPHLKEEEVDPILENRPQENAGRKPDVICFSIIDWEFRYQRPQQIMSQFAANGHRVFYISPSRFQPREADTRVRVKEIKKNVYEVSLMMAQSFDVYSAALEGENLRAALASLDELRGEFNISEAVSYVMIASWAGAALATEEMWGWRVVYDCMDEWENFPGIKQSILDRELELVGSCDLLVVTAQRLYEKWEPYNRRMILARNGVDYDFYSSHNRPNTLLSDIRGPIIGYYGAIADWFDLELLARVAEARPDYTFVLLGGIFDVDVSGLRKMPNVRLMGQQPYETMPQYLYHFDVCLIPFKINSITEATDPVKVYEYLSGGKPVVSVALPELEPYKEYLYVAEGADDFVDKLDAAVAEDDRERALARKALARQHTWEDRYKAIDSELARMPPRASIIIVTYNNLALTRLCIESVIRNTEYPNYEIIVVDNDSSDQTRGYLRFIASQYSRVSIILNQRNEGFARANNQGIARATGERIVLLNNDTIVPPGWLTRLLRHLEDDRIGLVGPVTNFVGNEARVEVPYRTWSEMEAFAAEYTRARDRMIADITMLAMFCVALRRETFEEIGPLDEEFGIGMFEDDDYSIRVKKAGYRIVCAADTFVHHFGQAAFKKLIKTGDYNPLFEKNREYFETKWNTKWVPHKHVPLSFERHSIEKKGKRVERAPI